MRVYKKVSTIAILVSIVLFGYLFFREKNNCSHIFLNNDFVCDKKAVIDKREYSQLKQDLEQYISDEKAAGKILNTSVYFRDLVSGPVMGISEFYEFAPASLLKLPFALVYFMEKENGEAIDFQQSIMYSPTDTLPIQNFASDVSLKAGSSYTVEDLLQRMISYSDNYAYNLLAGYLDRFGRKDAVRNTLLDFGILLSNDPYDKSISVRRYASIFRGLYNASLISAESSEKLLSWLSKSDFKNGLLAQLPKDTVAAHKFGERDLEDGTKQLHDCGIIYYPQNPYLLCVMTHGNVYQDLEKVIQYISAEVYKEVDSRRL